MVRPRTLSTVVATVLAAGALASCGGDEPDEVSPEIVLERAEPTRVPAPSPTPSEDVTPQPSAPEVLASDGRPRRADLSIPKLGLRGLDVVPYVGKTDDAPGTAIQNRGHAASPHGPQGGVPADLATTR